MVSVIRVGKCKYYEAKIDSCTNRAEAMWKTFNHITGLKIEKPINKLILIMK